MKKFTLAIIKLVLCAIALFLGYWFMLPPINLRSTEFYSYLIFAIIAVIAICTFSDILSVIKSRKSVVVDDDKVFTRLIKKFKALKLPVKVGAVTILAVALVFVVGTVIGAQIFNASRYNKLITMTDGDFTSEVSEISREQIPVVDRDTASRLGQRKLGEMSDLVSQFEIEELYTQINYNGRPVRVTPLRYGDAIKWLNNQKNGIPAYIMVDMTTQDTTLVRLNEGIKYSQSEYFMRNIRRKLRFEYPTKIFGDISFEIDDDGTPYWVASTIEYKIGLFSGEDIGGAVLFNAQTGESKYYDVKDVPTWVDQVYESDMILQQLIYNGKYRSGWLNSIFGQKGVLQPTDGYNYLAINDDVWLYTGITSVTSDESNVGFVLTNLRTKETKYYAVPGAEEYSAMSSAQGQVQHLGYRATFPLLLNVADRPSYFMALKDSAGLVKMYAFVDVQQYQIVGTGSSVEESRLDYLAKLKSADVDTADKEQQTISGTVSDIESAVVDGNTCYYIKLSGVDEIFIVSVNMNDKLPFMDEGSAVEISYSKTGEKITVSKIEVK
ncbi:MAG: CvpA family protein [Acutalibacteraceae bacterium]|nr:CvpA family protein [Acutalibacteraceae bacterium]